MEKAVPGSTVASCTRESRGERNLENLSQKRTEVVHSKLAKESTMSVGLRSEPCLPKTARKSQDTCDRQGRVAVLTEKKHNWVSPKMTARNFLGLTVLRAVVKTEARGLGSSCRHVFRHCCLGVQRGTRPEHSREVAVVMTPVL